MNPLFSLLRFLFGSGTAKFDIGDRVHLKNGITSRKQPNPTVYVIMDIYGFGYKLNKEGTCSVLMDFRRDHQLLDATGAPRNEIDLFLEELTERHKNRRSLAV